MGKNALERFNSRLAKNRMDEEAIKLGEIKSSTVEKQAENIMKVAGLNTQDIFMIITRDSIDGFAKLWNNSMENTIIDTLNKNIKYAIQETIQEELVLAYKGILKGLGMVGNVQETKIVEEETIEEEVVEETQEVVQEVEIKKEVIDKPIAKKIFQPWLVELKHLIIKDNDDGINVRNGNTFRKSGKRESTLYQRFMRENKGIRNAWNDHIEKILTN